MPLYLPVLPLRELPASLGDCRILRFQVHNAAYLQRPLQSKPVDSVKFFQRPAGKLLHQPPVEILPVLSQVHRFRDAAQCAFVV